MVLLSMALAVPLLACAQAPSPGRRIQEARYLSVGGIEQWVTIRGDDDGNPVLLLVHGGPGDVQSPYVTTYAAYEHDFVLVQWDQPGAGRTFAKNRAAAVTLEKQVADGIHLAEQLKARFPKQDLVVLGHSWGSVVATGMAQARPELFSAYVGSGQVSVWADSVQFQFDFLKDAALKTSDAALLASLEAIGKPDPLNVKQYFGFSRSLRRFLHPSDTAWFAQMIDLLKASGETEADIQASGDGMNASGAALIQSVVREDLPATAARFKLPYYVIQGRHDLYTPTRLAEAYFAKVSAPKKGMVVIESAGHFALATHPTEFVAALKRLLE